MRATSLPPADVAFMDVPRASVRNWLAIFAERLKEVRDARGDEGRFHHRLGLFITPFASDACHGVDPHARGEPGKQGRFRGGDR